jgi:hypothetical protein
VTGGPRTLGAPEKNDHKKFDSTFLGFLEKCFNFGEKYHISGKFLGVSGKFFSYLGKIGVCPENFFDSQNGTLTENFLAAGGGEVAEVEQRGAKSGRLTEGPQRLRYATGSRLNFHFSLKVCGSDMLWQTIVLLVTVQILNILV